MTSPSASSTAITWRERGENMPPSLSSADKRRQRLLRPPEVAYGQESASRSRLRTLGVAMADKSPRQHMSKKAGKSLKEKRADKHAKSDNKNKIEIVPPGKK